MPRATKFIINLLALLIALALAQGAQAAVSITRTSGPVFYSDTGNGLSGAYVSYQVATDTAITDAWAQIGSFSGPDIALATGETGLYHLGPMSAGSRMVYFYLTTAVVGSGSESHQVSVYEGKPSGGTLLGGGAFSLTQKATIQANANKVSSVITGPTPATLGGVITITVTGTTGTTGGTLAFTAATDPNWPAEAYKLYKSVINLPDGSVLTDAPYISAYSGTTGTYVATYSFTAEDTVSAPSASSATGYILSGQQMKHTATGSYAGNPSPPAVSGTTGNAVLLGMTSNVATLPPGTGGTVIYTLHLQNTGTADVTLDDIVDLLPSSPAAVSYLPGHAFWNGAQFADPAISGSQLTWSGAFLVPAGATRDLTFWASVPGTAGTYTNSAVAHIGTVQIDSTLPTTDNAPATCSLTETAAAVLNKTFTPAMIGVGQQSTLAFTISNSTGYPAQSGLAFTDTLPAGVTLVGSATSPQCGGTVSYSGGNVINLTGGTLAARTASCTISATVTSSTPGSYQNTYAGNISNLAGGLSAAGVNASLLVSAPSLAKSFSPATINTNQSANVVFTITNGSGNPAQTDLGFSDNLPSGLAVAAVPTVSSSCGGAVYKYGTTTPLSGGETSFSFVGGALAAESANCTVNVAVKPTTSTLTTYTNGPANVVGISSGLVNNITSQTLTVVSTPTLYKSFASSPVGVGQPSTLVFTINNPSSSSQSKLAFSDLFPAGTVVATPPNVYSTCGGNVYRTGTTSALTGGETALDFANGAVAASSTCTVSVQVTSPTPGSYTNGNANIFGVSGLISAVSDQTLQVVGTKLTESFADAVIITGSGTTLTFTITNGAGQPAQAGFGFGETLPSGVTLSGSAVASQCGGTVSYSGTNVVNFTGGSLSSGATACTVTVQVASSTQGTYYITPSNISNLADALDASGANASLTVYPPPSLQVTKSASPTSAPPGAVITYTYQVTNSGGPATNVTPSDQMSPHTRLVASMGGGGPFLLQEGTPASGLTLGTPLYTTDGVNWSTTLPANGAITGWKIPLTGTMNGLTGSGPGPNFSIIFQAILN